MSIGIDFGTTNSALVNFSEKNGITCLGEDKMPLSSIVALNRKTGEVKIGFNVKSHIFELENDHEIVLSIKTILDDLRKKWHVAGREWTTIDVAAEILKKLKENASEYGVKAGEAVFAVPVNFSTAKKICLREAAKQAGLKIKTFINEPTAAVMAHYDELKPYRNVVVFDWGGGTLDISAVEIESGNVREIYTDGMPKAGNAIDDAFARKMYDNILSAGNIPPVEFEDLPPAERDSLISLAESAKIKLSVSGDESTEEILRLHGKPHSAVFTRKDLNAVSEKLIDEAVGKLKHAVAAAFSENVGRILCVGGSCNLRQLREKMEKIWGKEKLCFPEAPEWDIAKGACIIDANRGKDMLSEDICLKLSDNEDFVLLAKGQPVPTLARRLVLSTVDCGDTALFVFKIGDKEYPAQLPVTGSVDECLDLRVWIDEDYVFRAAAESSIRKDPRNILDCDEVELCYHVEN